MTISTDSDTAVDGEGFHLPEVERHGSENGLRALASHSLLTTVRVTQSWRQDFGTLVQMILFPALTLVMFSIVLGNSVSKANQLLGDGRPAIYGYVSLTCLVGAMSGAVVSALGFMRDRDTGFLARQWTMPVHRGADIVGRMIAEALRITVTIAVIVAVGAVIGFRFHGGPLESTLFFMVPILFGMGFSTLVTAAASNISQGTGVVELVVALNMLLMFFNTGFVPVFAYPSWLQPFVANQPMSVIIDAMRALALDMDYGMPLVKALAWGFGLLIVFSYPAAMGLRKAALEQR